VHTALFAGLCLICNGTFIHDVPPSVSACWCFHNTQVPAAEKDGSVFAQLQGLFAYLALTKSTFANPVRFWNAFKDYDGSPIDVREHQDAYEFFTRLQVGCC